MRVYAQPPPSDIGLMWSLVAGVAVTIVTLPMPIVVEFLASQFRISVGRRATPQIEVHLFRNIVAATRPDRSPTLVAQGAR
jgi:hypothetical protein